MSHFTHSKLEHNNVLKLLGVCLDGSTLMIVLEHCSNENLKSFLLQKRTQSQQMKDDGTLISMICDMAAGLNHLHANEIAHK